MTTTRGQNFMVGFGAVGLEKSIADDRLFRYYFDDDPFDNDVSFMHRLHVTKPISCTLVRAVCAMDSYFVQKTNCVAVRGLSPLQKCTAAMRMLVYRGLEDEV
eukprot:IDg4029t1